MPTTSWATSERFSVEIVRGMRHSNCANILIVQTPYELIKKQLSKADLSCTLRKHPLVEKSLLKKISLAMTVEVGLQRKDGSRC